MRAKFSVVIMGLALALVAESASAYHITGTDADEAVSIITGATVVNDMWWAGTIEVNLGSGVTDPINALWATFCGIVGTVSPPLAEFLGCEFEFIEDPVFTQGVVRCEKNDSGSAKGVVSDANAGWGGRCSSSAAFPFTTPPTTAWVSMTVNTLGGCSGVDPAYFARVGNNVHGMDVASGGTFYYQQLFAHWSTSGHITYFIDTASFPAGSDLTQCYGNDTHTLGTAPTAPPYGCNDETDTEPAFVDGDDINYTATPNGESTVCA